ncbi:inosine/xanthosine triphosphatase [Candidatus Pacearchaeota archaeon]|nr:inosine/xanthosine triphosphatase [Candidatus Pacearchaeota archaeon]
MKINVASKNPVKVEAVREVLSNYQDLVNYEIIGVETNSGVSEQPKSLEETVQGAINRATAVFNGCAYSFGIESGLMLVPQTKTGSMDFCACAIYDGKNYHLGLSCAFEFPIKVTQMIHEQEIDANEAFYRSGLTTDRKIGSSEGSIGMLTRGRVSRKDYTKQAIQMALIHLENKELY